MSLIEICADIRAQMQRPTELEHSTRKILKFTDPIKGGTSITVVTPEFLGKVATVFEQYPEMEAEFCKRVGWQESEFELDTAALLLIKERLKTDLGLAHEDITLGHADEFPNDRWFRNAWTLDGSVNLDKAKEIQKDQWRSARADLLPATDVAFRQAVEQWFLTNTTPKEAPDIHAVIETTQALRDVTQTDVSQVKTPEELKAVWPEVLNA